MSLGLSLLEAPVHSGPFAGWPLILSNEIAAGRMTPAEAKAAAISYYEDQAAKAARVCEDRVAAIRALPDRIEFPKPAEASPYTPIGFLADRRGA